MGFHVPPSGSDKIGQPYSFPPIPEESTLPESESVGLQKKLPPSLNDVSIHVVNPGALSDTIRKLKTAGFPPSLLVQLSNGNSEDLRRIGPHIFGLLEKSGVNTAEAANRLEEVELAEKFKLPEHVNIKELASYIKNDQSRAHLKAQLQPRYSPDDSSKFSHVLYDKNNEELLKAFNIVDEKDANRVFKWIQHYEQAGSWSDESYNKTKEMTDQIGGHLPPAPITRDQKTGKFSLDTANRDDYIWPPSGPQLKPEIVKERERERQIDREINKERYGGMFALKRVRPEEAGGPEINPEKAVGPKSNREKAIGPKINPETTVGPETNPETTVGPKSNREKAVGPEINPEKAVGPETPS